MARAANSTINRPDVALSPLNVLADNTEIPNFPETENALATLTGAWKSHHSHHHSKRRVASFIDGWLESR